MNTNQFWTADTIKAIGGLWPLALKILRAGDKTDTRLGNVAVRLEKSTLPKSSGQRAGFLLALNTATSNINDLLSRVRERSPHNDTTPTWAQNWLAEIAVDEPSIMSAAQFALYWMKEVNLVSDIIAESQGPDLEGLLPKCS